MDKKKENMLMSMGVDEIVSMILELDKEKIMKLFSGLKDAMIGQKEEMDKKLVEQYLM